MFLELLAPAKLMSKSVQDEEVDVVLSLTSLQRANNQLNRLEKKAFRELSCVKRVLENIQEINNGEKIEYHYQGNVFILLFIS